jgi:hypothetical protein
MNSGDGAFIDFQEKDGGGVRFIIEFVLISWILKGN